ncbi:MAG: DNA-binding protein [Erysipelothrix sp.]
MKEHILKLMPGEDFLAALDNYCKKFDISAAYIGTCVGSLSKVMLRKGYDKSLLKLDGPYEIVSCVGTLSKTGMHIHGSVSDREFRVYGGHLIGGCTIQSTCEVVIIELENHELTRSKGEMSGYKELVISSVQKSCNEN